MTEGKEGIELVRTSVAINGDVSFDLNENQKNGQLQSGNGGTPHSVHFQQDMYGRARSYSKRSRADTDSDIKLLDVDEFLQKIGEFGKIQIILVFIFCFIIIPPTYQTLIMTFVGNSPTWRCIDDPLSKCNSTKEYKVGDGDEYKQRCSMNRSHWEFTQPTHFSIVTEWDLVCDKKELSLLANSAIFIGWAVGAIVLGWISDRFGRKCVLFPSLAMILLAGFASGFVQNFWLFFVTRLIIGFFEGGIGLTLFVMASELVGPRFRALAATSVWFAFTLALGIMGLQAYLIPKWRILEIISSAPYIVCFAFYWYVPESIRWLRVKNRLADAEKILQRVANANKKMMPEAKLSEVNSTYGSASFTNLFMPLHMLISTTVQCFAWFANGMVYYGISLASDDLGGNMYRDFVLTSLVEIPANIMVIILSNLWGRKSSTIFGMIGAGLSLVGVALIPNDPDNEAYKWSRVGLGMIGKLCITLSFNTIYIWSVELHPTIIRSQGMGLLSVVSRCGAAGAPWVATWLKHFHVALPFYIMGGVSLVSAFLLFVLHETKGLATAETMEMVTGEEPPAELWDNPFLEDPDEQYEGGNIRRSMMNAGYIPDDVHDVSTKL